MIKPTIGRVVWYHSERSTTGDIYQPWAALICYVHSDVSVNLSVFDENGYSKPKTNVILYQGEGNKPELPYCEWMPYQIGQAKAHTTAV